MIGLDWLEYKQGRNDICELASFSYVGIFSAGLSMTSTSAKNT